MGVVCGADVLEVDHVDKRREQRDDDDGDDHRAPAHAAVRARPGLPLQRLDPLGSQRGRRLGQRRLRAARRRDDPLQIVVHPAEEIGGGRALQHAADADGRRPVGRRALPNSRLLLGQQVAQQPESLERNSHRPESEEVLVADQVVEPFQLRHLRSRV